jgi:peptide/nickel transport system ATP-binding protein
MAPILEITDLSTHIKLTRSVVQAVGNVDIYVNAGETLGIVGESGSGKSMTGLSIMGLLPPGGSVVGGSIKLNGRELVGLPADEMRRIRGNDVAMVFQDPLTSLDPTKTIGYQVAEPVRLHQRVSRGQALERATEVLALVGLPRPKERLGDFPHQLSGGLRQRVMIAMALACEPKLLIADEPTTALDVTIQAQILDLMRDLKTRMGSAIMLITHDLGVVAEMAQRVVVMYAGRKVEEAPVNEIFARPMHPYTRGLLGAVPKLGSSLDEGNRPRLAEIAGLVPSLRKPIVGCAFAGRCSMVTDLCRTVAPAIEAKAPAHSVACHYAGQKVAA